MSSLRRAAAGISIVVLSVLGTAVPAAEAEYVVGPEDVLSVTVWEHPELSKTVVVRADGAITLPPLGTITVVGKGTETIARDLEARIYNVLRIGSQVTVSVAAFNSRQIYVAGVVANPGRYSYEEIPGLLDVLGSSGGLNATADLSNVRIVRKTETGKPETITVDVARAVNSGEMTGLPALRTGDVVYVPGTVTGAAGGAPGTSGVFMVGEVARPGAYGISPGMDLLQLLSLAGGSTPLGDLSQVELLGADRDGSPFRVRVDLNREIRDGRRGPEVRAGDTVVIPSRHSGSAGAAWVLLRETLGLSRDVINLFLIRDVIKN